MDKTTEQTLPTPPAELAHLEWRPLSQDDIPIIAALSKANMETDGRDAGMSEGEIRQQLAFIGDGLSEDSRVALTPDGGSLGALGLVFLWPAEEAHRITVTGSVHTDYRRQGLGSYLMEWLETRAQQKFDQLDDELPKQLTANTRTTHPDRIALFEKYNYTPTRYFNHMSRALDGAKPVDLPAGFEIEVFSDSRSKQLREAHNETFREHYNFSTISPEMWQEHLIEGDAFRADLSFVVLDGSEIAGYLLTEVFDERNAQRGISEAVMEGIGVRPAYHGRGIASAMMAHTMQHYLLHGFTQTALDVDTENITNALQLYEKMGFESVRTAVQYKKDSSSH